MHHESNDITYADWNMNYLKSEHGADAAGDQGLEDHVVAGASAAAIQPR